MRRTWLGPGGGIRNFFEISDFGKFQIGADRASFSAVDSAEVAAWLASIWPSGGVFLTRARTAPLLRSPSAGPAPLTGASPKFWPGVARAPLASAIRRDQRNISSATRVTGGDDDVGTNGVTEYT